MKGENKERRRERGGGRRRRRDMKRNDQYKKKEEQIPLVPVLIFVFFCIFPELFWHLSYQDHVTILTTIILPLTRANASDKRVVSPMLMAALSCLDYNNFWPASRFPSSSLPRNAAFYNTDYVPGMKGSGTGTLLLFCDSSLLSSLLLSSFSLFFPLSLVSSRFCFL